MFRSLYTVFLVQVVRYGVWCRGKYHIHANTHTHTQTQAQACSCTETKCARITTRYAVLTYRAYCVRMERTFTRDFACWRVSSTQGGGCRLCTAARTPVHFVRLQWKWFNAKYDPKSRPLSYGCRRRALVYIHMYHTYIPCIRPGIDYDGARGNLNKSVCIVESFVCAYTHIDVICPPLRLYKFTFNTVRSFYECIAPGERQRHVVMCATLGALLVHTRAFC